MKVFALDSSARKDGNTAVSVRAVFTEPKREGIQAGLVQLAGTEIRGCTACGKCFANQDRRSAGRVDILNDCIE